MAAVRYVWVPSRPDPADGGGEEVEGGHAWLRGREAQSSGQFMNFKTSQTVVNDLPPPWLRSFFGVKGLHNIPHSLTGMSV